MVNFLAVAVQNRKFGVPLEKAFEWSFSGPPGGDKFGLDLVAMQWATREEFQRGEKMVSTLMQYQHRGYAKYVDIVKHQGWDSVQGFWRSVQEDFRNGITYNRNNDPPDSRILRMSKSAGVDLTPLLHFWGINPVDPEQLKQDILEAGLLPSTQIKRTLERYRDTIPRSSAAFQQHAKAMYPASNGPRETSQYQEQYYFQLLSTYDEAYATKSVTQMQTLIDTYFDADESESDDIPATLVAGVVAGSLAAVFMVSAFVVKARTKRRNDSSPLPTAKVVTTAY